MAWKAALRSVASAARGAERAAERERGRAAAEAAEAAAAEAVAEWRRGIRRLVTLHQDPVRPVDWAALAVLPDPDPPAPATRRTRAAEAALAAFRPRLLDLFRGGSDRVRAGLVAALRAAREADLAETGAAARAHAAALAERQADRALARAVLAGAPEAFLEVLGELGRVHAEEGVAAELEIRVHERAVHVLPLVAGPDIVPRTEPKLRAGGRLVGAPLAASRIREIHLDHVASVALRLAADILRLLPVDLVRVTARMRLLDPATGHHAVAPVISVEFPRARFEALKLDALDPSEAVRGFRHALSFGRSAGFRPVEPLD